MADKYNNRVVWFNNAYSLTMNNSMASGVLGQGDFISGSPNRGGGTAQNSLYQPSFVYVDESGNLFVSDTKNNRVLRFNDAASKPNGANANGVLGQSGFTVNSPGCTISTINNPCGLAIIGNSLFVSDKNNHRVLKYADAINKPNGANADAVLGQVSFTNGNSGCSENEFNVPLGLSQNSDGSLFVVDYNNNRALIFENANNLQNGANADFVLGQQSFNANTSGLSQSKLHSPYGLCSAKNEDLLFVADYINNRILQFGGMTEIMITTNDTELVSCNAAICGGIVLSEGNSPVYQRGTCWGSQPSPTIDIDLYTVDGSGSGSFTSYLNNLSPNTTYYYRAYAINNSEGIVYGTTKSFVTPSQTPLEIIINHISYIDCSMATVSSLITSDGGFDVLSRGICWGIAPDPDVVSSYHTNDGAGNGELESAITLVEPNQTYYIRAYAINATDTAYSENSALVSKAPVFLNLSYSNLDSTSAMLVCDIDPNNNETELFFEYGTSTNFNNSIIADPSTISGNGYTNVHADIDGLDPFTQYFYRVKTSNSDCYGFSEENMFVTKANIKITSPGIGEEWQIGRAYNIQWTNVGGQQINLEYNIDDKPNWNLIAENIDVAQNYYNWVIPDSMTTNCKVRAVDLSGNYVYDIGEAFTIVNPVVYSGINFNYTENPVNIFSYNPENPENVFAEGQKVRFKVSVNSLFEFGILTMTGIIKSDCPYFTITKDYATYNNISASGSKESWDYYEHRYSR